MAHAVTYDTLKFVERLKSAGTPEPQAKAISEAFKEAHGETELATTKQDIRELDLKIQSQFMKVQDHLVLLRWMFGFMLAGIAALIIKTFF